MKRRNTADITTLLADYLRAEGLETPLAQHRAIEAWPRIAGEAAAASTQEVTLRDQTLIVRLSSSVIRHELLMRSDELLRQLNQAAGAHILYHLKLL